MSSMLSVTAIIINFKQPQLTIDCLKSLAKLKLPSHVTFTSLVIDNASGDDSVNQIQKAFSDLHLIANPDNTGFSGANNQGARLARDHNADFILLLNNDTVVDPHLVSELLASADRHPDGLIFAPKIYFAPGYEFHHDRYSDSDRGKVIWFAGGRMDWANVYGSHIGVDEVDKGQHDTETSIKLATGCCMLVRRSVFQSRDLFDSRYFMYYEDAELSARITSSGKKIYYVPTAKLWHINAGSSGSGSHLHDYFLTRNRLLLGFAYAPLRTRFALIRESLRLLFSGRPWQKRGVADFFLRRFGKGSFQN